MSLRQELTLSGFGGTAMADHLTGNALNRSRHARRATSAGSALLPPFPPTRWIGSVKLICVTRSQPDDAQTKPGVRTPSILIYVAMGIGQARSHLAAVADEVKGGAGMRVSHDAFVAVANSDEAFRD